MASKLICRSLFSRATPIPWRPTRGGLVEKTSRAWAIPSIRSYSSLPPFSAKSIFDAQKLQKQKTIQRREYVGGTSQNLLAHMEQTANNNPSSATAQNAFYSALLRANMPAIVVERYQTGRFATNAACQTTYVKALERLGQTEAATTVSNSNHDVHNSGLSEDQMKAIGQAVASARKGKTFAVSGKNGASGTGERSSPLYVVVDETLGSTIFKWIRFIISTGITIYLFMLIGTLLLETSSTLKKVSGTQANEAQAQHQKARFSDVHGCDEAKEELQELVEFLKDPAKFSTLGGKLPKGVLLVGPPGTGKTLLARAVAGEAGVPFFFMSGSEFDEVYVGVGAKRIRELFNQARGKAPAIIFIDELDAVGGKRNERDAAYVKQTLNQLLTELDGFSQDTGVIILGATNFPQLLDKALTRPGRFDRHVTVPLPDVRGRMSILKHHMKTILVGAGVDISAIARGTPGFSGAELENLVNQAAVRASRNKEKEVSMIDLEWAKDKIMMGAERRSAVIQQKDKVMTAYHEGGHTLVAMFTAAADPVYKATIMPRGHALGITFQLPEMDQVSMSKKQFLAKIDVCMGGKVAEEMVYGEDNATSGASSDIQTATKLAYAMVTQYGFSDKLGNFDYDSSYDKLSVDTKKTIEAEVRGILDGSRARAEKLLTERKKELDLIANALVEYEMLNLEEMKKILKGEKLAKLTAQPGAPIKMPELAMPPPPPSPPSQIAGSGGVAEQADEGDGEGGGEERL